MAAKLTIGDRKWISLEAEDLPMAGNGVKDGDGLHILVTGEQFIFFDGMWEPDLRLIYAIQNALN